MGRCKGGVGEQKKKKNKQIPSLIVSKKREKKKRDSVICATRTKKKREVESAKRLTVHRHDAGHWFSAGGGEIK